MKLPIVNLTRAGFTMIEVALSLAIMGFALVSILLVLPSGMNTQRDTRQETIVNQDATVLLEAIRGGARGLDDLTNYVYTIVNTWAQYNANGAVNKNGVNVYTFTNSSIATTWPQTKQTYPINSGIRIVGLLSTPLYTDGANPIPNLFNGGYSNHVVAYVRSISGLAAEKPPQDNPIMQDNAFAYRVICVNAPVAVDTNTLAQSTNAFQRQSSYSWQLACNVRELRLLFQWPLLPNGQLGGFVQNYRATIAGQFFVTNQPSFKQLLYFYQSDTFTNTP